MLPWRSILRKQHVSDFIISASLSLHYSSSSKKHFVVILEADEIKENIFISRWISVIETKREHLCRQIKTMTTKCNHKLQYHSHYPTPCGQMIRNTQELQHTANSNIVPSVRSGLLNKKAVGYLCVWVHIPRLDSHPHCQTLRTEHPPPPPLHHHPSLSFHPDVDNSNNSSFWAVAHNLESNTFPRTLYTIFTSGMSLVMILYENTASVHSSLQWLSAGCLSKHGPQCPGKPTFRSCSVGEVKRDERKRVLKSVA